MCSDGFLFVLVACVLMAWFVCLRLCAPGFHLALCGFWSCSVTLADTNAFIALADRFAPLAFREVGWCGGGQHILLSRGDLLQVPCLVPRLETAGAEDLRVCNLI